MLILVVGPSGAGKDTMLATARARLAGDPGFRFVRRAITRPADAGGEDHEALTPAEFATRRFALSWQAHGLSYGVPIDVEADLSRGVTVIANVSRSVITDSVRRYPTRVILVTAPPMILAARLAARGRETATDIAARLVREVALPDGIDTETVLNDATLEEGAERFVAALVRARGHASPGGGATPSRSRP